MPKMPTKNILLLLLLVMAFSNGPFSTVEALKCYEQGLGKEDGPDRDKITVGKCWDLGAPIAGCIVALGCDGQMDMRGCTPYNNSCQMEVSEGKTLSDSFKHCEFCNGNLCNNEGMEKTGLKCIAKDEDSGVPFVEECLTGHVGCVAAWDCKDPAATTTYGCWSDKNFCKKEIPDRAGLTASNVCNCIWCISDLCNYGGIKEKPTIGGKPKPMKMPTPPKTEKPTPKTEVDKPNNPQKPTPTSVKVEQPTPKTDGTKQPEAGDDDEEAKSDPPNGAVGCGQIVIIPIGITLVLGGGLLKMLMI